MKMLKKIDILFEIKSMGLSFYVPFFVMVLSLVFFITDTSDNRLQHASRLLEFFVCPFSAWWSLYLFLDYYEDHTLEVLLSYPISAFFHGLLRVGSFLVLFLIPFLLLLWVASLKGYGTLKDNVILYIPQMLFYSSIGFFLSTLARNIILPLSGIIAYISLKYITLGNSLFPVYNVMSFSPDMIVTHEIIGHCGLNVLLVLVFFTGGQILFSKRKI
ncbi:hypothetical protein [Priestia endophytica]|uniref:hypothetical protein n=1 Tax=Priestia endophytica TaxID=135735 RepID=UPI00203FEE4D|nr:hypothetical protein [Priestia endophytica]MCM3537994.1 hypothetical protein [Priestia endophytica]